LPNTTGAYTYTPHATPRNDSFAFLVQDGERASTPGVVEITRAPNYPPSATNSTLSAIEGQVASGQLIAQDPDGDTLTYSLVTPPSLGVVDGLPNTTGQFTFDPGSYSPSAPTRVSFAFKVSDGEFESSIAGVSIDINWGPTARDDAVTVLLGADALLQLRGTDPNGDQLSYAIESGPQVGTLLGPPDSSGRVLYRSTAVGVTSDSFTFSVTDATTGLQSQPATVTVTIDQNTTVCISGSSLDCRGELSLPSSADGTINPGQTHAWGFAYTGGLGSLIFPQLSGQVRVSISEFPGDMYPADSRCATVSFSPNLIFGGSGCPLTQGDHYYLNIQPTGGAPVHYVLNVMLQ
jgi:hypothetical protein